MPVYVAVYTASREIFGSFGLDPGMPRICVIGWAEATLDASTLAAPAGAQRGAVASEQTIGFAGSWMAT